MDSNNNILVINPDNVFILSLTERLGISWWGDRNVEFVSGNGQSDLLTAPDIINDPRKKIVVKELPIHDLDPQILDLTWADFVIFTSMELIQETPVPMTDFLEKYYPCRQYIFFAGGHVSYPFTKFDSRFYVNFKETFARVVCANPPLPAGPEVREKLFDVLLGTPKFERQFVLQGIRVMGLDQECIISMHPHCEDYYPPFRNQFADLITDSILDYESSELRDLEDYRIAKVKNHLPHVTEFCSARLSDTFCMTPVELERAYDFTTDHKDLYQLVSIEFFHAWCSHLIPEKVYNHTWYSIVVETHFFGNLVTEKTAKCLLAKRPFILFGAPQLLKHLKDLGFKTFDTVIDESYDQIIDPAERFQAALYSVNKLRSLDPTKVYHELRDTLEHNYNLITDLPGQLTSLAQFVRKNLP